MYDFFFGTREQIQANEETFLISIKRMLPKWMNSIPDSEFLALHRVASNVTHEGAVFAETGVGASSIVLLFHAMKNNGMLYSWDTNAEKASQIRIAAVETIARYLERDINDHWRFVNYMSTSPHAGVSIIREIGDTVALFFHDSEHVLDVIVGELDALIPAMARPSFICMDDANYNFKHINTAFINIVRKKLSLDPIAPLDGNACDLFYKEVEAHLKTRFVHVEKLDDTYKRDYKDDVYFAYFNNELNIKASLKMENLDALAHRFDAWRVS